VLAGAVDNERAFAEIDTTAELIGMHQAAGEPEVSPEPAAVAVSAHERCGRGANDHHRQPQGDDGRDQDDYWKTH
jgi:hypothetical protein